MRLLKLIRYYYRTLIWIWRAPLIGDELYRKRTGRYRKNPNYEIQESRWSEQKPKKDY